jgi:oligosaccharide amylase
MPRSLVLGNDHLHVAFDQRYMLRDLFYPMVGQENHLAGKKSRTGVWADGQFSWLDDEAWQRTVRYEPDSLVTAVKAAHAGLGIEVTFNDAVDIGRDIFLRKLTVRNTGTRAREVRVFFHYDFHVYGTGDGDTAFFEPDSSTVVAYKGRRYLLLDCLGASGAGVKGWATGIKGFRGLEGTWRDAEDGVLEGNPVAQGSVDATVALAIGSVAAGQTVTGYHWLVAGQTLKDVKETDALVRGRGPESFVERTRDWWKAWSRKEQLDCADLGDVTLANYRRSLLIVRTHADAGGAIVASTDSDIIQYSRDTYAYCWPRDGAVVSIALNRAGHGEVARRFFTYCQKVFWPFDGYFLHKFTPAGSVASTWHSWASPEGKKQLAIQEDETGLVLHALWQHYRQNRDIEFMKELYRPLIRAAADFMVSYRDESTKLCLPSYDLWEERWGVHAYTVAAVWAGITAAANFAEMFNQAGIAASYRAAAAEIRESAIDRFWDPVRGHFARSLVATNGGDFQLDPTIDASALGMALMGMVPPDHPRMSATAAAIRSRLWVDTPVGGLARYEHDQYQGASQDGKVPGNPWVLTTLWLSRYYSVAATDREGLANARSMIRWAEAHMGEAGTLAEQLDPANGQALSVAPLTWSHAEYILAIQHYAQAAARIG